MTSEFAVAVHALVFLNRKGGFLNSEVLADNICTNSARVRKVMSKLRKSAMIETKEGLEGGYHFIGEPDKVSLAMVSDALAATFVSSGWKSGSADKNCLVASGMAAILDEIYDELNHECRRHLENITIADLDQKITGLG